MATAVTYTGKMRDIVIELRTGEYGDFVSFLQEQGFERILLNVPAPAS